MAANVIKCVGLRTSDSELTRPSGSLKKALNVNVNDSGIITPRRGFNDFSNPTNNSESTVTGFVTQIMEYKNRIIRKYGSSLEYEDLSNVFQPITGSFNRVLTETRTKWQEANSNLYFTTDEGIKKISETSSANFSATMVKDAGGLKAGYASGVVVPTVGGFLPASSKVGYRVLFGTKDNNNNLIYGSPSARFVVTNYSEDVETYETASITMTPEADLDIADGDYFTYTNSTGKYVIVFDTTGSTATIPKTAETIGGTYIYVDVSGVTGGTAGDDETSAAILANSLGSSIANVTVTVDANVVTITSTEEDDITGITTARDATNTSTPTGITTATTTEGATTSGTPATVTITGVIPNDATIEYFYQVYRTATISTSTGLTINDLDPGDEMNIVYESGLTSAEISAGEFSFTDTTPESFRAEGAPLYTNNTTGEGILQSNEAPPIAVDMELFRNYMFYANTKQRHKLEYTIISVDDFISDSTRFIIGNEDITRFYTFVGTAEVTDVDVDAIPAAGDYLNLYSANDERQYYLYFGDTGDDPEVTGAVGYRVSLDGYTPADTTLANRESFAADITLALADNVDFGLSVSSDTITFTHTNNGYTTGITNGTGSGFTINTPSTDGTGELAGTDEGGDVLLSGLTSVGQSIDETARSLVKIISKDSLSPVNAYYLSTGEDLPGNILLESRSLEDKTFYIAIDEPSNTDIGGEFNPELPYSQEIEEYTGATTVTNIKLTGHPYATNDQVFVSVLETPYDNTTSYLSASSDIVSFNNNIYECILNTTGNEPSGDTSDNTYWKYISPEFSGVYTVTYIDADNFSIPVASPTTTTSFVPSFSAIYSPDVESDNEAKANRIYYSKRNEPEAVPVVNYIDVGTRDGEISRILALRDELYILKDDGTYVLSGTSAPDRFGNGGWSVRLIDNTRILAPDSAVVLNNQIYCLTEQGVARISGSSVAIISRGIENLIDVVVNSDFDYSPNTFGISYENDRAYILFMPSNSSDTSATQAFRFNYFEQTWTRWEYEATCGYVLSRNNKLYLGNGDRNYISQERKNNNRTDHSDRNFSATINPNGINEFEIELSSLTGVEVNDVIVQQQDVTITFINDRLLRKMDYFDSGIPDGMYDTYGVSVGDNLATKMQDINDYLRSLDSSNITAKSFTLNNLRTNTQLLVDELNATATITSIKTYKDPYTIYYEAYITEKDVNRNTITVHAQRLFVEGSIEVYKGFTCTAEWNPQHFGDPSALKHISYVTIMFDQNNFYKATAKFASDASQAVNIVEFDGKGIGYWGDLPWGTPNAYWGGNGNDVPFRNPVPRGKQKCRYLSLTFEHKIAREDFRVIGISGEVRMISNRAYRNLA